MIFSLDKKSGKKCFMIGARGLGIIWGDDQRYWRWIAEPNSRFDQVAQLMYVWWFHIIGSIETKMLSTKTTYAAYLVFRFRNYKSGFHRPAESRVAVESHGHREWPTVILDPRGREPRSMRERGDGWLEIEMGEFYNENGDDGTLDCGLKETDNYTIKRGLVVEGIELRPKETQRNPRQETRERRGKGMWDFSLLGNDVISRIIFLTATTPRDACRVASVSTFFRSIADSDEVWRQFLPPDHRDGVVLPQISRKKSLYFHLCDRNMSGKKCFMIGARELAIDQRYWTWIAEPNSRFGEVAQLLCVDWFHIVGRIETKMLSTETRYAAYLVFRFGEYRGGFDGPAESSVSVESHGHREWSTMILDPREGERRSMRERGDGWLEIKMGEFYNENGDDGTLECSLKEVVNKTRKCGLVVEGIELRPTY
ncbi:hypothetical protein EUGRSUZ_H00080 [Eucalyptus grandis]|uniref:Uncharacterized protein n=2 Tax=Eucalyptus grandis TaxID=71139 RepID=A0ACC3JMA6_EUCGR|nr:hypothetical protein EUGRSUZ_H00080 [Eucalyptus grandis]